MDELIFDAEYRNLLLQAERRFRSTWSNTIFRAIVNLILMACVLTIKCIFFFRDVAGSTMSICFVFIIIPLEISLIVPYLVMSLVSQSTFKPSHSEEETGRGRSTKNSGSGSGSDLLDFRTIHLLFWNRSPISTCQKFTQLKVPTTIILKDPEIHPILPPPFSRSHGHLLPLPQKSDVFVRGWRHGEQPSPVISDNNNAKASTWIGDTIESLLPDIKSRLWKTSSLPTAPPAKTRPAPTPAHPTRLRDRINIKTYGKGGAISKSDEIRLPYSSDEDEFEEPDKTPRNHHLHYGRRVLSHAHDLANNYPDHISDREPKQPSIFRIIANPSDHRLLQRYQYLHNKQK